MWLDTKGKRIQGHGGSMSLWTVHMMSADMEKQRKDGREKRKG